MMFDAKHVFINGEAFRAGGKDATLIRLLADQRRLNAAQVGALGVAAQALLLQWIAAGWVHGT
jgi:50S ribosomal protein L16 3-hydroxylase